MSKQRAKYREYDATNNLIRIAEKVRGRGISIYMTAKEMNVPWSTLKDFLAKNGSISLPKLGKPFALTSELKIALCKCF